ncbi:zinc finger protein 184-like [Aedes albopictus]|uniref:C2H2-type domain-containing protein n=1 Tax=Aedes albopictus TaxID=7160 RepID=A0ABM1XR54_AEDAL
MKKHERSQLLLSKMQETEPVREQPAGNEMAESHFCTICSSTFSNKNALQKHSKRHQPGQCDVCHKTFQDRRKLMMHMKLHGPKNFMCPEPECGKSFIRENSLHRHAKMHENKRQREAKKAASSLECDLCEKVFHRKTKLLQHKIEKHGLESHNCQFCIAQFTIRKELDDHLEIHAKLSNVIQDKPKMNKQQLPLQEHVVVKTEPTEDTTWTLVDDFDHSSQQIKTEESTGYEDMIDIGAVKIEDLNEEPDTNDDEHSARVTQGNGHQSTIDPISERKRRKPEAGETGKKKLKQQYDCSTCQKTFKYRSQLEAHEKQIHGPKTFGCNLCDAIFRRRCDLVYHKARHAEAKKAGCYPLQVERKNKSKKLNKDTDGSNLKDISAMPKNETSSVSELQCSKCSKVCPDQHRLWLHYVSAHRKKNIQCPYCSASFYLKHRLDMHIVSKHKHEDGSAKPVQCEHCNEQFKSLLKLSNHMQSHKPKKHSCTVCNRSFRNIARLEKHKATHIFDGVVLECELCNKTFSNMKMKSLHMRSHKPKKHQCHICNKECAHRWNLMMHLKTHERENCIVIKNPLTSFPDQTRLLFDEHEKDPHGLSFNEITQKVELDDKKQSFNGLSEAKSESKSHSSSVESDFQLEVPEIITVEAVHENVSRPADSNQGLSKTKKTKGSLPVQCNICGKVSSCMRTWLSHKRKVHGPKKFECHICGRPFYDRHTLGRHIPVHDPAHKRKQLKPVVPKTNVERPFKCDICQKSFRLRYNVTTHKKTVHAPKTHGCDICDAKFTIRSFLVRHMKIHNRDAASLECNICNLTFSSFPQRVGHMIKHLPKKYQCPFCSKSCTLRANLDRHMKTHDEYHDSGLPSSGVAELEPDDKAETTIMEQAVANE